MNSIWIHLVQSITTCNRYSNKPEAERFISRIVSHITARVLNSFSISIKMSHLGFDEISTSFKKDLWLSECHIWVSQHSDETYAIDWYHHVEIFNCNALFCFVLKLVFQRNGTNQRESARERGVTERGK